MLSASKLHSSLLFLKVIHAGNEIRLPFLGFGYSRVSKRLQCWTLFSAFAVVQTLGLVLGNAEYAQEFKVLSALLDWALYIQND